MPPKTRKGKRKASQAFNEDSKENSADSTTASPAKIKNEESEPATAILRSGFAHSTALFSAQLPGAILPQANDVPQKEVDVKVETTPTSVTIPNSDSCQPQDPPRILVESVKTESESTMQDVVCEAKNPKRNELQIAPSFHVSSSPSWVHLSSPVSAKALEQNLISVAESSNQSTQHEVNNQLDEVEEVEVEPKAVQCIDLTMDDISPASTQPPSPVNEVVIDYLENDKGTSSVDFPTPLLPLLDRSFFNLATISAIITQRNLERERLKLHSLVMVSESPEDQSDTTDTDADSVICCNSPSIAVVDVSIKCTENSTAHPNDKLSVNSNALNVVFPPKSNSKDIVDLTVSPITLDSSSSSSTPDINSFILPSVQEMQQIIATVKLPSPNKANNMTTSSQISDVDYSSIPMDISPSCSPVKPAPRVINSALLNIIKNTDATASSTIAEASQLLEVPQERTNSQTSIPIVPISYPPSYPISTTANVGSFPSQSRVVTQEHVVDPRRDPRAYPSPSHSVLQEGLIASSTINLTVSPSHPPSVPRQKPISSTSHLNALSSHAATTTLQTLSNPQNKRKLPEDPRRTKRLNIQEYQNRKAADPRIKASHSLTSTPSPVSSVTQSVQSSSPGYSPSPQYSPSQYSPQYSPSQYSPQYSPSQYSPQYSPSQYGGLVSYAQQQEAQNNPSGYPNVSYGQYHGSMNFAQPIGVYPSSHQIQSPISYPSPFQAPLLHRPITAHPFVNQRFLPRLNSLGQGPTSVATYPVQTSLSQKEKGQLKTQENLILPRELTNKERTEQFFAQISISDLELNAPSLLPEPNLPSLQEMHNRPSSLTRPPHAAIPQPSIPVVVPPLTTAVSRPSIPATVPRPMMPTVVQQFISCIPEFLRNSVGSDLVDTEHVHLLILDWDVTRMYDLYVKREFPKLATEVSQVRNSYSDHLDYYNIYFPLMLVEHWSRVFKEYNGILTSQFYYFVVSKEPEDLGLYADGQIVTTMIQCDSIVKKGDKNTGLKSEIVAINILPSGPKIFGYVRESSHRSFFEKSDCNNPTILYNGHEHENRDILDKVRLKVEVACNRSLLKERKLFMLSKVMIANTLLKQNDALRSVERSNFKEVVLNPLMGNVELFRLPPSGTQQNQEADCLSSMTDRVSTKKNQMTLVAVSEFGKDQFHALSQVVRYLRRRFQPRLLVVCPEDKMRVVAKKLNQLGFELMVLDREVKITKQPGDNLKYYDQLVTKSSARTVLEDCEVMLVPSNSSFHPDIEEKGLEFDTCILFDAHHLTEPESVAPLAYTLRHFVALGVPNTFCNTCDLIADYDYKKSLFQRMYETCG